MAAKRRRRGDYTEQEIRAENREWVRHLMQLANIDSNKKGGSKVFGAARKLAAECCPEEFRERVQKLPFKANTRTVHAVACDEIIREVQGPQEAAREAEAAEAAEEEPRLRQRKKAPPRAPARPEAAPPERPRQGLQRYFAGTLAMQERPPERRRVLRKPQLGQEDPKGHYKALQLTRDASIAEVHKAYRRRALETHPDKGGSEQAFRLVREAFELLSDVAKRRAYDGSGGEVSGDFEEESDGAKSVLAALLMNLLDKEVVSFLEVPVLENVRLLLKQMVERSSESGSRASAAQTPRGTGLVRRANGEYDVKVSWACFSIQALRIGDLQTACTLQSAFAKARERARQRINKEVDEAAAPPLTVEELCVFEEYEYSLAFSTQTHSLTLDPLVGVCGGRSPES
ncbi:unnamed protein product [Effrenium voratum]|uniref:J domain-containing protein n=1 Tax=Effrenium voratum TaxID=2562239 RepID=A0AA36JIN7_9DINO|nr:unnamed protein product [Effrenium voratum]